MCESKGWEYSIVAREYSNSVSISPRFRIFKELRGVMHAAETTKQKISKNLYCNSESDYAVCIKVEWFLKKKCMHSASCSKNF